MKLLRIGKQGSEKVAVLHNNKIKDLSGYLNDLNPQTLNKQTLKILKEINFSELRELDPNQRIEVNTN